MALFFERVAAFHGDGVRTVDGGDHSFSVRDSNMEAARCGC